MGTFIRFITAVLLVFFLATTCTGQTTPVDTSAAYRLQIYRRLIWDSLPQPVGRTNDYEGLFSDRQEMVLDSIIADYETKTTIQILIITVDTVLTAKQRFDDFVLHVHNRWGVGTKAKNNGIVIGICAGYRQMRISNGYGIEAVLSDSETAQIVNNDFVPFFKRGDYYGGTLNGLRALIKK